MRDPYEVLGVNKGADAKAIKRAYRKLARELHPDLHPGDRGAEERFKDVAAAYDFLSDAEKKASYDRGEIDASGMPRAERRFYRQYADAGPGARYAEGGDFFRDFEGADIFSELFRGARRQPPKTRGTDVRHQVEIEFLDAINGSSREIVLPDGRRLKVTIPPGTDDGQVLRLKGQGTPSLSGGPAGDLNLEIQVRPHPRFRREGNDMHAELPITLAEAVLGGRVDVETLDGTVSLTIPPGANSGMRLRIRGKGAPPHGDGSRGDLYVTLKILLPKERNAELEAFIREWAPRNPYRVRDI
jgi:DnaJ-class molecular chaperone